MHLGKLFATTIGAVALTWSIAADAMPLVFDFAGPSGTAVFRLDSDPTPDFAQTFLGSDMIAFDNVAGIYGGIAGTAASVSFGRGGLFAVLSVTAPNLGFTQFLRPELFTGLLSAPHFSTGSFVLINPFFGDGALTISEAPAAVPEAAIWAMMIVGFGLVGGAVRIRRDTFVLA